MKLLSLPLLVLLVTGCVAKEPAVSIHEPPIHERYLSLLSTFSGMDETFKVLNQKWEPNHAPMALDTLRFSKQGSISNRLVTLLESKTGQELGFNANAWLNWLWKQDFKPHAGYSDFKAKLYWHIDPKFAHYFDKQPQHTIRLDEVRWGGVVQDGIPPLRKPKMLSAKDADYLADGDIVFGIEVDGEARAYPKRILAWHEMFVDTIQGIELAGVY